MSSPKPSSRDITAKSKAAEVQQAIGSSKVEWSRFLVLMVMLPPRKPLANYYQIITAEEGARLIADYDKAEPRLEFSAWREVPAKPQQKVIDDVKRRLLEEEIARVDDENQSHQLDAAIRWRMTQVIKSRKARPSCEFANLLVWRITAG